MKNSDRRLEIDIAKGFAIICMVLVHTIEYFYNKENSAAEAVVEFLGSPFAAPVFMFAMGIGFNYTKNPSPMHFVKRGGQLLVMSYVFNLLVYAAPYFVLYLQTGDPEYLDRSAAEFASVDILQFAALAMLTFAVIKKLNLNSVQIAIYAAAVSLIGQFLTYFISPPEGVISYISGILWGSGEMSYFPYCSWIAFPLVGYLFGRDLINCEDKPGLYKKLAIVGIPLYFAMTAVAYFHRINFGQLTGDYQEAYYHMGLYGNVCMLAFVFGWISICYLISLHIPKIIIAYFSRLCKNITRIYVVQYILIIYAYVFIAGEENNLSFIESILVFAVIFALSDMIAFLYSKVRARVRKFAAVPKENK